MLMNGLKSPIPNTLGMALFGDGEVVASKPHAASGKYINCMSNYCSTCACDPDQLTGDKACPFNALYWDFMARYENTLRGNQRLPDVFWNWANLDPEAERNSHPGVQHVAENV